MLETAFGMNIVVRMYGWSDKSDLTLYTCNILIYHNRPCSNYPDTGEVIIIPQPQHRGTDPAEDCQIVCDITESGITVAPRLRTPF